ncbi:MAG: hypothetical protein AB7L94_26030, partial [Kofleriaceae bacterium]
MRAPATAPASASASASAPAPPTESTGHRLAPEPLGPSQDTFVAYEAALEMLRAGGIESHYRHAPYSVPPTLNAVVNPRHVVDAGQPVFAGGLQIFAHFIAVPCVTHVKPAAHLTVDEHVAPCPEVPAMRQSAICLLAPMYVAVNKSHVQFVGHSGFVAAAGSQF